MALPLPKVIPDVGPGGGLVTAMRGGNALAQDMLKTKYYAPNIQSQIDNRNALTNRYNTMTPLEAMKMQIENQYLPNHLQLANQLDQQKFEWNPINWQSENSYRNSNTNKINQMLPYDLEKARLGNQMAPLEIEQQRIKNQFLPQSEQARIAYQNMGGGRGSVAQKDLAAFERQLQMDNQINPDESQEEYTQRINDLSDAYGRGETTLPNGQKLPQLSWHAQQLQNSIMNRNIPVAAKNQLLSLDTLVHDMNNFDINAVADFAGPQGKIRLAQAKAKMVTNPDDPSIDPMARRYLSAMKQAIINMDQMRKSFGTSVVPDYVYETVGKLTNPNDSIWNDKTQVKQSYNDVLQTLSGNRDMLRSKYRQGINASSEESNSGSKKATLRYNQQTGNFEEIK